MHDEMDYPRTEPSELVELALHELEEDLYGAGKDARRTIYEALLDNFCHMLLIDGGPTFALEVLEKGRATLRKYEADRGRKELGPFLTKAHCEKLNGLARTLPAAGHRNHRAMPGPSAPDALTITRTVITVSRTYRGSHEVRSERGRLSLRRLRRLKSNLIVDT